MKTSTEKPARHVQSLDCVAWLEAHNKFPVETIVAERRLVWVFEANATTDGLIADFFSRNDGASRLLHKFLGARIDLLRQVRENKIHPRESDEA